MLEIKCTVSLLALMLFVSCGAETNDGHVLQEPAASLKDTSTTEEIVSIPVINKLIKVGNDTIDADFSREKILLRLKNKKREKVPLIVHAFVPLCDNENQGIVPVNASLGNGMNLRTNLYWGAGYGVKTHFKRDENWILVSELRPLTKSVLERVIYKKNYPDSTMVFLIADAYRGDKMKECLEDYLLALSGKKQTYVVDDSLVLGSPVSPDLLIFNGHNGMMDVDPDIKYNKDSIAKDAVAIACFSGSYFNSYLKKAGGYPLVTTTHLLAPEAYVIKSLIDEWAMLQEGDSIRKACGKAYSSYHSCGIKAATNLFHSGWWEDR